MSKPTLLRRGSNLQRPKGFVLVRRLRAKRRDAAPSDRRKHGLWSQKWWGGRKFSGKEARFVYENYEIKTAFNTKIISRIAREAGGTARVCWLWKREKMEDAKGEKFWSALLWMQRQEITSGERRMNNTKQEAAPDATEKSRKKYFYDSMRLQWQLLGVKMKIKAQSTISA